MRTWNRLLRRWSMAVIAATAGVAAAGDGSLTRYSYDYNGNRVGTTIIIPATGVTLTPSLPSPQAPGTAVSFTAAGQGSSGYQYRFWLSPDNAATWAVVQDWSATDTWTLPSTTAAGSYVVLADVKTNTATTLRDTYTALVYTLGTDFPAPATGVTLTPSLPSPQVPGTAVIFTAAGQGSTNYQYRFWLSPDNGATWAVVQDWSTTDTWTLPSTTGAGSYVVLADVKTMPGPTPRDAYTAIIYTLGTGLPPPATGVTLAASAPSPHTAGTDVTFTAAGQGSTGYLYRFWLTSDGGQSFTVVQDWSSTATWTLPGTTGTGAYQVIGDVKTDPLSPARDAYTWFDYVIIP